MKRSSTPIKATIKFATPQGKISIRLVQDCEDAESIVKYLRDAGCNIIRVRGFRHAKTLSM